jgi:hypothetical protein
MKDQCKEGNIIVEIDGHCLCMRDALYINKYGHLYGHTIPLCGNEDCVNLNHIAAIKTNDNWSYKSASSSSKQKELLQIAGY